MGKDNETLVQRWRSHSLVMHPCILYIRRFRPFRVQPLECPFTYNAKEGIMTAELEKGISYLSVNVEQCAE